jgi:hypothetical protein
MHPMVMIDTIDKVSSYNLSHYHVLIITNNRQDEHDNVNDKAGCFQTKFPNP